MSVLVPKHTSNFVRTARAVLEYQVAIEV